jgi:hypothetical protein
MTHDIQVHGNSGGFSLRINTPCGDHTISAYGRLRVDLFDERSITISKASQLYTTKDFYLSIIRDEEFETLSVFIQTGGISQTTLRYPRLTTAMWQDIVTAARQAEKESGHELE